MSTTTVHKDITLMWNIEGAIEQESSIPVDVKQALKDFVKENYEELMSFGGDLLDFHIPEQIAEWWPIVVELLKSLG